jgi:Type II secretion system (T2SS), protein G
MFRALTTFVLLAAPLLAGEGPQDPAKLLPPKTIFYIGTPSLQAGAEAAKNSAMRKILDEPEVKAFLAKPVAAADKILQDMIAKSGLPADATPKCSLADMIAGNGAGMPIERFFLALTHVSMPAAGGNGEPDVGLVLGVEMKDAKDLGLVKALWAMLPATETPVTHGTHQYLSKQIPNGPAVSLAFLDRMAVLSLSPMTMETVLDNSASSGASLADTADYKQLVGLVGSLHADSATWMLRLGPIADVIRSGLTVARMAAGPDADKSKIIDAIGKIVDDVGLSSIPWMGGESHRDATGKVIGMTGVSVSKDATGLVGKCIASSEPVDAGLIKTVPANCLSMSMFSVDFLPYVYDFLVDTFRAIAPDEAASTLATIQTFMGDASLRDDLLANAHGVLLSYGMAGEGFPGQPTSIMRVPLRNPEGFIKALNAVVAGVANTFPQMKALKIKESTHEQHQIYEIDMSATPGAYVMMQPALAVDDGALLLCPQSVTALKTALNGLQGGTLADNKEFMAFVNGLSAKGKLTALSFEDNARTFGAVYGQVAPMFSMMGGMLSDIPVDLSLIPTEKAISSHLGLSWAGSYNNGNGLFVAQDVSEFAFGDFVPILLTAGVIGVDMASGHHHAAAEAAAVEVSPAERVQADLQQLSAAMTIYKITQHDYPKALAELVKPLPDYPEGCLGKPDLPKDPWGQDYLFKLNDKHKPVLWSAGPNKQDDGGAGDDIVKK